MNVEKAAAHQLYDLYGRTSLASWIEKEYHAICFGLRLRFLGGSLVEAAGGSALPGIVACILTITVYPKRLVRISVWWSILIAAMVEALVRKVGDRTFCGRKKRDKKSEIVW